jgi:hypothetical protein
VQRVCVRVVRAFHIVLVDQTVRVGRPDRWCDSADLHRIVSAIDGASLTK